LRITAGGAWIDVILKSGRTADEGGEIERVKVPL
jgi:hypothetical protein